MKVLKSTKSFFHSIPWTLNVNISEYYYSLGMIELNYIFTPLKIYDYVFWLIFYNVVSEGFPSIDFWLFRLWSLLIYNTEVVQSNRLACISSHVVGSFGQLYLVDSLRLEPSNHNAGIFLLKKIILFDKT